MEEQKWLKDFIEAKFEASEKINDERHKEVIKRLDYTNGKVRKLEIWKGWLTGGLSLIGFLVGILIIVIKTIYEK
jgi:beta-lactamase class D